VQVVDEARLCALLRRETVSGISRPPEIRRSGEPRRACSFAQREQEALRLGLTGEVVHLTRQASRPSSRATRRLWDEFVAWCSRGPPAAEVAETCK